MKTQREKQIEIGKVIAWTTGAAREAVELARFNGEAVDVEGEAGLGLWQSFEAEFDAEAQTAAGIRELAIFVHMTTFEETVKAVQAALVEAGVEVVR